MSYSFGGVPFSPLIVDWVPAVSPSTNVTRRPVPYAPDGGLTVVDSAGRGARAFRATIRVDPGDTAGLEALLGEVGTVVLDDVDYGDGVMMELTDHEITPGRDLHRYRIEIVLDVVVYAP